MLSQATEFVNTLCDGGPQTFVIIGKKPFFGYYHKLETKLRIYNEDLGKDVYCTVNGMDGKGRTMDNVVRLRAIYADYDKGVPPSWAIPPSIVVESSPGKAQTYWLLTGEVDTKTWRGVQRAVVQATGADPAAIDVSRILRVPGFINHKYETKPATKLLSCNSVRYLLNDIKNIYGCNELWNESAQNFASNLVQDDVVKLKRYRAWLAAAQPPAAGNGERNGWFYRKAAAGVRDFALPVATVADILHTISLNAHGDYAYEYDECYEITSNAERSATGARGSKVTQPPVVVME